MWLLKQYLLNCSERSERLRASREPSEFIADCLAVLLELGCRIEKGLNLRLNREARVVNVVSDVRGEDEVSDRDLHASSILATVMGKILLDEAVELHSELTVSLSCGSLPLRG